LKLRELGEFGFIDRIAPGCLLRSNGVERGIGDDCAVVRCSSGRLQLVTTDLLVEKVHFLRNAITPSQLGAKALAVSISDVAAMGGRPLDAFVSIAVPSDVTVEYLDAVFDGMKRMASRFDINVLGGDTTGSPAELVINVALTGEVDENAVLYRDGARPGDVLYVTGFLGDSRAGLDAVLHERAAESEAAAELVRRHHEVTPHVREGQAIATTGLARAMIDVSDGLASDLPHLCVRGHVGAVVEEARLPVSEPLREYCASHDLDPYEMALSGGEDYVLLLAGDPRLPAALSGSGVVLHAVGRVVEEGRHEVLRRDGERVPLARGGWDHFRVQR
jgi:thiamine-monophosphate kinase